jgi:hypothetical protein
VGPGRGTPRLPVAPQARAERPGLVLEEALAEQPRLLLQFGPAPVEEGQQRLPLPRVAEPVRVDVLVVMDEPAFPGCVVTARLVGVIEAEQSEKGKAVRNDRLVAVLDTPRNPSPIHALDELGRERLDGIEHFFVAYNEAEGRIFHPLARHGAEKAINLAVGRHPSGSRF